MPKSRIVALVTSVGLLLSGGVDAAASAGDLYQTASTAAGFKQFVKAVKLSGMQTKIATTGPYTLFAPSDEAFGKLTNEERDSLYKDKARLAAILSYHIIPGRVLITEVKPGPVETLEGHSVTLKSDNGKVTINGANVTQSDLAADNGVIHEIDALLTPP
ncbi:MAG: fasciclin protein [Herminiimonas sp.]|nr:fasciclin protein [Herminiimonas sp.]MDB5856064.1 fasciclin protein [Herminiimonas sp.]